jgi:hypothetical protein
MTDVILTRKRCAWEDATAAMNRRFARPHLASQPRRQLRGASRAGLLDSTGQPLAIQAVHPAGQTHATDAKQPGQKRGAVSIQQQYQNRDFDPQPGPGNLFGEGQKLLPRHCAESVELSCPWSLNPRASNVTLFSALCLVSPNNSPNRFSDTNSKNSLHHHRLPGTIPANGGA